MMAAATPALVAQAFAVVAILLIVSMIGHYPGLSEALAGWF